MTAFIVDGTVNSVNTKSSARLHGSAWQPQHIGASAFLDTVAADVAKSKRIKALDARHVYAIGEHVDWRHVEHCEIGLIARRSSPSRLVFYTLEGPKEYAEVTAIRTGEGWAVEAPANAPEDVADWLA